MQYSKQQMEQIPIDPPQAKYTVTTSNHLSTTDRMGRQLQLIKLEQ